MKYKLAMGTIFRDESRYMREWLEYHLMVGFDHFFMLQNDDQGTTEYEAAQVVLAPYIKRRIVTVAAHEDRTPLWQVNGWQRIMADWSDSCRWLALTDLDVFVVPMKCDSVLKALRPYYIQPEVAALAVNYCTFGDSHLDDPPALQTESLVLRGPLNAACNFTQNYIVRPDRMQAQDNPQGYYVPRTGLAIVDTDFTVVPDHSSKRSGPMDVLRMHHYGVRSKADWARKVARGWPDAIALWNDPKHKHEDHKHAMINRNEERDDQMLRFLPGLKARLATRNQEV